MTRLVMLPIIFLSACNHMHVKPGTMTPDSTVFAVRGGYSMRMHAKERLEMRGYAVKVGRLRDFTDGDDMERHTDVIPNNAKYTVIIRERPERFRPLYCFFNGFWWWNFNVSIAEQATGEELLVWAGRGCANSSLRRLDRV
ncbi:MAG: hypothetical protein FWE17_02935, partial [Alphaproteobacteria bacterium]|nr:hypothetical protein [Alphaproteobacteria bacterium]